RARNRPADLRYLEAVGQPDAEMIAIRRHEHLRLVTQAAKGDRMDDPVAVALKRITRAPRRARGLAVKPPESLVCMACRARQRHLSGSFSTPSPAALVQAKPLSFVLSRKSCA